MTGNATQTDTRTDQVVAAIRRRIASRALEPGEKLPSIRGLAKTMQLSPSTVVTAYDRLAADGVIFARRGSGFFVADVARPFSVAEAGPQLEREINPFWVSRQSLDSGRDVLKPGCGWMPADWMPEAAIRKGLRALARADASLLTDYGETRGAVALRQVLARQTAEEGLPAGPEQILLTSTGTQAIDLICRFFLKPGDTVLVDDPCYFNFQALLRAHRVEVAGVPFTPAGPDMAHFEEALQRHKPKLYITNSALHNPTGATLSAQTAHKLLTLAAAHNLIIIEDDIFARLSPEPQPSLAVLDGLDRVIRIGSFSKTVSASIRCGYIAARADWIEALVDLQVATNFGGPSPIAAELLTSVLTDGSTRKHLQSLHSRLAKARREVAGRLKPLGITPWVMPKGGFYLWCHLPDGLDATHIARAALAENVVLAPGNVFSVSQSMTGFMRFNVSQMRDGRVYEVLGRVTGGLR
ncbi:aminotransferase-like domain-containing protein [Roseibium sp. M-1]